MGKDGGSKGRSVWALRVLGGARPSSLHLKSPTHQHGEGCQDSVEAAWAFTGKPPELPHGSCLIGFNYFLFNYIFKSFPQWFLDQRTSPLLSLLWAGGLAWVGVKRQSQVAVGSWSR